MKVMKFGGSSVGNPERIKNVIKIINDSLFTNNILIVVFSAFQGVTDELIKLGNKATSGVFPEDDFNTLTKRHMDAITELVAIKYRSKAIADVKIMLNEIEDILKGISYIKDLTRKTSDVLLSYGERLSAYIIYNSMKQYEDNVYYLDSRDVIKTDSNYGMANVNFEITNKLIQNRINKQGLYITTGFIASDEQGNTTTLGRGGSDYTASIFGAALGVEVIEIWTDVDGILTADPRYVPSAFSLKDLSYDEAMELSHFGAKVIYPPTMRPAMIKKIPILVKNSFNPEFPGTKICIKPTKNIYDIKGISSLNDVCLVRVQGSGMIGVSGIAGRIFSALAKSNINVILITQASSEHSICFAILPEYENQALKALKQELKLEIANGIVNEILIDKNLSIVAVVGENMRHRVGLAAKVFNSLGKYGVNIVAIAQGSTELNISAVISKNDVAKAQNAIHNAFFFANRKEVNLFIVGLGLIGKTFLKQINERIDYLVEYHNIQPKIVGIANSKKMLIDENGIDISQIDEKLIDGKKTDLTIFTQKMQDLAIPNKIFIDCTASEEPINFYPEILNNRIFIVTPNKKANSSNIKFYHKIHSAAKENYAGFYYEANVGAGLPIINTIKDLIASGDEIIKIEGVLSGTISYLFNNLKGNKKFSDILTEIKGKGFLEPDPRDDLSGMDVARKILILAREAGSLIDLNKVNVENLIPKHINIVSVENFWNKIYLLDDYYEKLIEKADKSNTVLRYIATYNKIEDKANAKINFIPKEHPFFNLRNSENIVAIYTNRYLELPLIVKGPGAGAEVTAGGVFADFLKAAKVI